MFTSRKAKTAEVGNEEEESDEEEAKDSAKLLKNDDDEILYEKKLKSMEHESHGERDDVREKELRNNSTCLCCDVVARGIKSTALYSLVWYVFSYQ